MHPRPYPSSGVNPENVLYEEWKTASQEARPEVETRLIALLRVHAAKVCWLVLHNYQPDYIEEVLQDALLDLPNFEQRSEFSTWFHGLALNKFRRLFRQRTQRKEVPLSQEDKPEDNNLFSKVFAKEIIESLTDEEKELVHLRFTEGLSFREIADHLGISHVSVLERWVWLQRRLKERYGVRK